jgi:hypothetical protein
VYPYTILVNSSDNYVDCWQPFFVLFNKFWPSNEAPIILISQTKVEHQFPGVRILGTETIAQRKLTWTESLLLALDHVESDYVLYFQEDYFLDARVRDDLVQDAVNTMLRHPEILYVGLTKNGLQEPYEDCQFPSMEAIREHAWYRISTQAGLWKKNTLISYLKPEENGWMFEIYGTLRSWKRNELFLRTKVNLEKAGPAISYPHTGIIKGKWNRAIVDLFKTHSIVIDYNLRGFHQNEYSLLRRLKLLRKLLHDPILLLRAVFDK